MFRRLSSSLPPDVPFPADLAQLGYFINEKDQIRQMVNPEQKYQYRINRSDRVNDVYKEAMNTCTRREVTKRLHDLGLEELRLPLGAGEHDKHVPVLVSPNLSSKRHVIVLFPERHNDPGILSYRIIGEEGVSVGSIVNFVKSVLYGPEGLPTNETRDALRSSESATLQPGYADRPGIVIANTSQLTWYWGGRRPVTDREWMCLPRPSAVHEAMRIDETENRVSGNTNFKEHIHYVFEHILLPREGQPSLCDPGAKISVIGLEFPGSEALNYLVKNWLDWRDRVNCIALVNPQHNLRELSSTFDSTASGDVAKWEEVTAFIERRCKAYRLHQKQLDVPVNGKAEFGCNVYSAGEKYYDESCFVRCWGSILDFVNICWRLQSYSEPDRNDIASDDEESSTAPIVKNSRKAQTDEQAQESRFHGELKVTEP